MSQARGWIGGEIAAFDETTGACKVLVDDICLGSTHVDANIPSLAIHLCSGGDLTIKEVRNTPVSFLLPCSPIVSGKPALGMRSGTHFFRTDGDTQQGNLCQVTWHALAQLMHMINQHIQGQGVFVRLAYMSDSAKLCEMNQELELELAMLNGEDETPMIDEKEAFSTILDEQPSALIVVIGARDEQSRENVFGYCYSYREQAPGSKVARGRSKKNGGSQGFQSSLFIAEMFVDKSRRACGFGEMLLIETLR